MNGARRAGMKAGKRVQQPEHLYTWGAVYGASIMDGRTMDAMAYVLSAQHYTVLYCKRWLLGNLDPASVAEHSESFDFLHWLCDCDSNRVITPGVFMAALMLLEYPYRPTLAGFQIGCTADSVRDVARRQTNGGG